MSVEFSDEKNFDQAYSQSVSSSGSGLTNWLIKKNIVKSEGGAKVFMVFIMIVCFGLSIFIVLK